MRLSTPWAALLCVAGCSQAYVGDGGPATCADAGRGEGIDSAFPTWCTSPMVPADAGADDDTSTPGTDDASADTDAGAGLAACGRPPAPAREPLFGVADLHAHPANHLSYAGSPTGFSGLIWGAPHADHGGTTPSLDRLTYRPASCGETGAFVARSYVCEPELHTFDEVDPIQRATRALLIGKLAAEGSHYPHSDGDHFRAWPHGRDVAHQAMQVEALRRAYEGGLRLMVAAAGNAQTLALLLDVRLFPGDVPVSRDREMAIAVEQLTFIRQLAEANPTWMRVVTTAQEADDAIRADRLAIVLGVELDALRIEDMETLYRDHGVRHITPVHFIDNDFGGCAAFFSVGNAHNSVMRRLFGATELEFYHVEGERFLSSRLDRPLTLQLASALFIPNDLDWNSYLSLGYEAVPACCGQTSLIGEPIARDLGQRNARGVYDEEPFRRLMRLGMMIDLSHMGDRTIEGVTNLAESFGECCAYPLQFSHGGVRWHDGIQGGTERAIDQRHWERVRSDPAGRPTVIGVGVAREPELDLLHEQRSWHWGLGRTPCGDQPPRLVPGARGSPSAPFTVEVESALSFGGTVEVRAHALAPTTVELRVTGRRSCSEPSSAELITTCVLDQAILCRFDVTPSSCVFSAESDWDVHSIHITPYEASCAPGGGLVLDSIDTMSAAASSTGVDICSAPPPTLDAGVPADAGDAGVVDSGSVDAGFEPGEVCTSPRSAAFGANARLDAHRPALALAVDDAPSPTPTPPVPMTLATRTVRVTLQQGETSMRRPAWPFEGTRVCVQLRDGTTVVSVPDPALHGDCVDDGEVDMTHGGSWDHGREIFQFIPVHTESEVDHVRVRVQSNDVLADELELVEIRVEAVIDPILSWTRDYRAHYMDEGALGTDLNGLQETMPFSDVPTGGCDALSYPVPAARGETMVGPIGPFYVESPALADGTRDRARIALSERGLASVGLLPDLFRAIEVYDAAERDGSQPGPTVLGSLFQSADRFVQHWRSVEEHQRACTY